MKLELITWKIVGIRPLMQSNPIVMQRAEEQGRSRVKKVVKAFDEAKAQLYLNEDEKPYHPAVAFWKALFVACPYRDIGKMAAATAVASAVSQAEEEFLLCDPASLGRKSPKVLSAKEWVVDVRRVVNQKAGALLAARPKWRTWGGLLTMEIDREFIPNLDPLTQLMNIAGRYGVGVGRLRKIGAKAEWGGLGLGKYTAELKA
jgi:hypothetical protein